MIVNEEVLETDRHRAKVTPRIKVEMEGRRRLIVLEGCRDKLWLEERSPEVEAGR